MGLQIDRENFTEEDFRRFSERLRENLADLEDLLARPGFGEGEPTLGAELEVSTVDGEGRPLLLCDRLLGEGADPNLQAEIDCFNLEYNLDHIPLAGRPFSALKENLQGALSVMEKAAAPHGGRIASIGILPTLREEDLQAAAITDAPRFRVLSAHIRQMRGGRPFAIEIDGPEPLSTTCSDVTMEGANNSFQVHWRVPPSRFAAPYNAAQVVTAPVLAACGNSPFFLGHRLWEETRVVLFKQAVDTRGDAEARQNRPARVLFGNGWVRAGALELFSEAVALYPPLLPLMEEPKGRQGELPTLQELSIHLSSVWHWNRPVYDFREGGHLRIELRALPSGPTPADMAAGAALLVGAAAGLAPRIEKLLPGFPFWCAERNFFRAAKHGLEASLLWPAGSCSPPESRPAREVLQELFPLAEEGLASLGVDGSEARAHLDLIRERVESGTTPARWQERLVQRLEKELPKEEALAAMLQIYMENARTGRPVSRWSEELP